MLRFRVRPCTSLLLRPIPGNERFGLGPFFRIEPLGMEYIAAALEGAWSSGRPSPTSGSAAPVEQQLRRTRPDLVGIAGMHALETDEVLGLAARDPSRSRRAVPIVDRRPHRCRVSGAVPVRPASTPSVLDDGERALPRDRRRHREAASAHARFQVSPLADQSGGVRRTEATSGRRSTWTTFRSPPGGLSMAGVAVRLPCRIVRRG